MCPSQTYSVHAAAQQNQLKSGHIKMVTIPMHTCMKREEFNMNSLLLSSKYLGMGSKDLHSGQGLSLPCFTRQCLQRSLPHFPCCQGSTATWPHFKSSTSGHHLDSPRTCSLLHCPFFQMCHEYTNSIHYRVCQGHRTNHTTPMGAYQTCQLT